MEEKPATEVIWSPEGRERFREVYAYLYDTFSPAYADEWTDTVLDKLKLLEYHPQMGRVVPEKQIRFMREVFAGKYRLIYTYLNGKVTVVSVKPMGSPLNLL